MNGDDIAQQTLVVRAGAKGWARISHTLLLGIEHTQALGAVPPAQAAEAGVSTAVAPAECIAAATISGWRSPLQGQGGDVWQLASVRRAPRNCTAACLLV